MDDKDRKWLKMGEESEGNKWFKQIMPEDSRRAGVTTHRVYRASRCNSGSGAQGGQVQQRIRCTRQAGVTAHQVYKASRCDSTSCVQGKQV